MAQPLEFEYLRFAAEQYGLFYFTHEFDDFVAHATEVQVQDLAKAYNEIDKRVDAVRISEWVLKSSLPSSGVSYLEMDFARKVGQMFVLFDHFREQQIAPFSSEKVKFIEVRKAPNWNNVPQELSYLVEVAIIYGVYLTEIEMLDFLDHARDEDLAKLSRAAERMRLNNHMDVLLEWLNRFPIDGHTESQMIYSVVGVMDHAGLRFD